MTLATQQPQSQLLETEIEAAFFKTCSHEAWDIWRLLVLWAHENVPLRSPIFHPLAGVFDSVGIGSLERSQASRQSMYIRSTPSSRPSPLRAAASILYSTTVTSSGAPWKPVMEARYFATKYGSSQLGSSRVNASNEPSSGRTTGYMYSSQRRDPPWMEASARLQRMIL